MSTDAIPSPAPPSPTTGAGWLRGPAFDLTLILGVGALALVSGAVVIAHPELYGIVLLLDLWLLGYHHVVATFTRLAFDRESLREHRYLLTVVPLLVLAGVIVGALTLGGWILATTYLYWQWFHYTRQSYGIERVYRRKAGGPDGGNPVPSSEKLTTYALYAVALWGILYRSYQAPETFLGLELKVLPVPRWLMLVSAGAALATLAMWSFQALRGLITTRRLAPHSLYVASHMTIFILSYVVIEHINDGWLVVNIWHNAQYILFVWLYNSNRYKKGIEPGQRVLSYLSQRRHWPYYFLTTLVISTVAYFGVDRFVMFFDPRTTLPLFLVVYQTINFHHYIVDGLIWKVRKKPLQKTLGLAP